MGNGNGLQDIHGMIFNVSTILDHTSEHRELSFIAMSDNMTGYYAVGGIIWMSSLSCLSFLFREAWSRSLSAMQHSISSSRHASGITC